MEYLSAEAQKLHTEHNNKILSIILKLCHDKRPISTWQMRVALDESLKSLQASIIALTSDFYPYLPKRISLSVVWEGKPPKADGVKVNKRSVVAGFEYSTNVYPPNLEKLLRLIKERDSIDTLLVNLEDAPSSANAIHDSTPETSRSSGSKSVVSQQNFNSGVFMAGIFAGGNDRWQASESSTSNSARPVSPRRRQQLSSEERDGFSSRREIHDHGTWESMGSLPKREIQRAGSGYSTIESNNTRPPADADDMGHKNGRHHSGQENKPFGKKPERVDEGEEAKRRARE